MITIIGAGPAGCYAAYLLAKKGFEVDVYEEHSSIGSPVQCTGIVTSHLLKILKPEEKAIKNKITLVKIISPQGKSISLRLKNPDIVLDRKEFDLSLANLAESAGAHFHLSHKLISYDNASNSAKIKGIASGKIIEIKDSIIIAADGPNSMISSSFNKKKDYWFGIQHVMNLENENSVEFFPGIASFAWIVPESKGIARVGIIGNINDKHIKEKFEGLLQKRFGSDYKKNIVSTQAGLIPKFDKNITLQKNNAFLIGDAASLIKATTAGGIIQSLQSAEILADCIANKKDYQKEIRARMFRDLKIHSYMRSIMDRFDDNDWKSLFECFESRKAKSILEKFDRDSPKKLILRLIIANPKLLLFSRFLLKANNI